MPPEDDDYSSPSLEFSSHLTIDSPPLPDPLQLLPSLVGPPPLTSLGKYRWAIPLKLLLGLIQNLLSSLILRYSLSSPFIPMDTSVHSLLGHL